MEPSPVARSLSDSFAGIAPSSVPGFVAAQAVGGVVGFLVLALLRPGWAKGAEAVVPEGGAP